MADTEQQMLASLTRLGFSPVNTIIAVLQVFQKLDRETLDDIQKKALEIAEFVFNIQYKVFIFTADRITTTSATVGEILKQTAKIPAELEPKVSEIWIYLKKANKENDEIFAVAEELTAKISEAALKEFRVTSAEMHHIQRGKNLLDFKLKTCRDYLNAVEKVTEILVSDGKVKTVELGAGVAATAAGGVVLLAKAAATVAGVVQGSLGVAVGYFSYKILGTLFDYTRVLTVERAKIESQFRIEEQELDNRQRYKEEMLMKDIRRLRESKNDFDGLERLTEGQDGGVQMSVVS